MAKRRRRKNKKARARRNEIVGIVLVALALVLLVGLLISGTQAGAVGSALATALRFLAGHAAVIIPIFILFWGVMLFADKGRTLTWLRLLGLLMLFFAALGLMHMGTAMGEWSVYIKEAAGGAGGGVLGGAVAYVLRSAFGQVGAIIILLAIAVIGVIVLAQTSLANAFSQAGAKLGVNDPDKKAARAELREQREALREQKEALREQRREQRALELIIDDEEAEAADDEAALPPLTPPVIEAPDLPFMEEAALADVELPREVELPEVTDPAAGLTDKAQPHPNQFAAAFFPAISGLEAAMQDEDAEPEVLPEPKPETVPEAEPEVAWEEAEAEPERETEAVPESAPAAAAAVGTEAAAEDYVLPTPELLTKGKIKNNPHLDQELAQSVATLEVTLSNFGIKAKVTQVVAGPAVIRYELQPAPGVKVSKITGLADDIALSLAATDVRIEAPIPGKSAVGIEVPRGEATTVHFRELIESDNFKNHPSKIAFALGKNIGGEVVVGDLAKMPHLLIAGSTGSGKSVCINTMICSILYKAKPDEVKIMLIDPKKVELVGYNGLPHLVSPVITDCKKAAASLKWVVNEMENRYTLFSANGVKDFKGFNAKFSDRPLHQLIVIIDELADLMFVASGDVEEAICRIAQMARAAGIHLVIATQRPSVDVITGLIKANVPSRIAFAVSSNTDSRTILDMSGAEKLLGRGDMLYHPVGMPKPLRVQGSFIEEADIYKLVEYCHAQAAPSFFTEVAESAATIDKVVDDPSDEDALFFEAAELLISTGQASASFLQRRLRIGNPRASRLIDILEQNGVVSGPDGSKPRNILMTLDEFNERFRIN